MNSSTDVTVGRVRRAHGIRGDVLVDVYSDHPGRFVAGAAMRTEDGTDLVIARMRPHGDGAVVHFRGVDDRDTAETLRGRRLLIEAEVRRALDVDEYWPDQLVGLEVTGPDGAVLGVVVDVVVAAQDRLVIEGDSGRFAVPFVVELVPEVDVTAGVVRLAPIPGLVDGVS